MAKQEWKSPNVTACSEKVINEHLKTFKITGMAKKDLETKIAALTKHMETVQAKNGGGVADCTTCGGDSFLDVEVCPFCGDGEIDEDGIPEPAAEPAKKATSKKAVSKKATTKKVVSKKATTKKAVSKTAAKEALKTPAVRKKRALKKKKKTSSTAVVKAPKPEIVVVSSVELDSAVKKVKKLGGDVTMKMYQLGVALYEIYDTELWKQRTKGEGGASVYRNWKQFCKVEFGMTAKHAYDLMDVSKAFTEEEVKEIGVTKLAVALKVPEEHKDKLIKAAAEGASVRELQEQADEATGKPSKKKVVETEGEEVTESTAPASKPKKGITVAYEKLRVEMALFKKPAANAKDGAPLKPAKTIKDAPFAEEISQNGEICTRYTVTTNKVGELKLTVERTKI